MEEPIKKVMTDEVRRKLAGFLPVCKTVGIPFTPPGFEDEDLKPFAPVYMQRSFTEEEKMKIYSMTTGKDPAEMGKMIMKLARASIIGGSNLWDLGAQETFEFEADEKGSMKLEQFEMIPLKQQMAIFYNGKTISGLDSGIPKEEKESLES